jgi:hypothetical protein
MVHTPGAAAKHDLYHALHRQLRTAIRLTAKHRAGRHFAGVNFMLRRATWQGDYGRQSALRRL